MEEREKKSGKTEEGWGAEEEEKEGTRNLRKREDMKRP